MVCHSLFVTNSLLRKIILIICVFLIIGALIPVHAEIVPGKLMSGNLQSGSLVSQGCDANLIIMRCNFRGNG